MKHTAPISECLTKESFMEKLQAEDALPSLTANNQSDFFKVMGMEDGEWILYTSDETGLPLGMPTSGVSTPGPDVVDPPPRRTPRDAN